MEGQSAVGRRDGRGERLQWAAWAAAVWGVALGPVAPVLAADPVSDLSQVARRPLPEKGGSLRPVADVELSAEGLAQLRLRGMPGEGGERAVVATSQAGTQVAGSVEAGGLVSLGPLTPGVYRLSSGDGFATVRCWASGTAPPGTPRTATVTLRRPVVRAQAPVGLYALPRDPAFAVGSMLLLAGAISIPIAIADANEDIAPASP